MPIYKLWKGTIHKVTSSNLVIFRQHFTFAINLYAFKQQNDVIKTINVRFCFGPPPLRAYVLYRRSQKR